MNTIASSFVRAFSILRKHITRALGSMPACSRALCHPPIQYRVALLLATILALFLGWVLFLSTCPHASFTWITKR